ncbi:MAG: peptidylprolyl isomerase [Solirubrobacteraceae bacterium]
MPKIARIALALSAFFVPVSLLAGCGGVPGNAVASISGQGVIKRSDFNHWLAIAAASNQQSSQPGQKVVVPDPPNYTNCIAGLRATTPQPAAGQPPVGDAQLKAQCAQQYQTLSPQVVSFLISAAWIQGEAADQGVDKNAKALDAKVIQQFNQTKQQSFPTPAAFQQFLQQSGQTIPDLLLRVKLSVLSSDIRNKVTAGKGNVSEAQIQQYYNQNQARFSQPERRDLLVIQTKTLAQANSARALLNKHTPFASVAKRYSVDQASKAQGGKLPGVVKGQQAAAFDAAIFAAPANVITGPVKTEFGYYVFEVTKITPGSQQSLAQEHNTIQQLLASQNSQGALQAFVAKFTKKWTARTDCRSGFVTKDCKNYKAPKTSSTLPPGAVPQTGAPQTGAPQTVPQSGGAGSAPPSSTVTVPSGAATTTP